MHRPIAPVAGPVPAPLQLNAGCGLQLQAISVEITTEISAVFVGFLCHHDASMVPQAAF